MMQIYRRQIDRERRGKAVAIILGVALGVALNLISARWMDAKEAEKDKAVSQEYYHTIHAGEAQEPMQTKAPKIIETASPAPNPTATPIPSLAADDETDADYEVTECPISEDEVYMLAQLMQNECGGVSGDNYGVTSTARKAAVAWVVYNRLDSERWGGTVETVITAPGQFAYYRSITPGYELVELAQDVTNRWWRERCGDDDVGRVIPGDYLYFYGDGRENHFRTDYSGGTSWDWSLPDPYRYGD